MLKSACISVAYTHLAAEKVQIRYDADGVAMGEGLFPLYFSKAGVTNVATFPDINKYILLPLALDYRKNKSENSLKKALYIYDWFHDQGWADGSGMGTLCFEKLRSADVYKRQDGVYFILPSYCRYVGR